MTTFREMARAAFPQIAAVDWIVFDPAAEDDGYVVPLETAPDELILADANWFMSEEFEIKHAQTLRAFVEWRRNNTNVRFTRFGRADR